MLVAVLLALFGGALVVMRVSGIDLADPNVLFDFSAYYFAAERMAAGGSPYSATQLDGSTAAYCRDCYLYPPVLAQLLAPLAALPLGAAKLVWLAVTSLAAYASVWLATGIGGAGRSLERALWCLVAALLFNPVISSGWVGNVGSLVALTVTMVAMGGAVAGIGAGLGFLLKVAPGALMPAAIVADRRSRIALLSTLAVTVGASFILSPQAWLDYPAVLGGVFSNSSASDVNYALNHVAARAGWGPGPIYAVRVAMLAAGLGAIALSMWLARRADGMPAAALLGTVALLVIPGALWDHYLVVLLPFAAMAWPRTSAGLRVALLAGAVAVSSLPTLESVLLLYAGALLMLLVAGWVIWPRRPASPEAEPSRSMPSLDVGQS